MQNDKLKRPRSVEQEASGGEASTEGMESQSRKKAREQTEEDNVPAKLEIALTDEQGNTLERAKDIFQVALEELQKTSLAEKDAGEDEQQVQLTAKLFEMAVDAFEREVRMMFRLSGNLITSLEKHLTNSFAAKLAVEDLNLVASYARCLLVFGEFIKFADYIDKSISVYSALSGYPHSNAQTEYKEHLARAHIQRLFLEADAISLLHGQDDSSDSDDESHDDGDDDISQEDMTQLNALVEKSLDSLGKCLTSNVSMSLAETLVSLIMVLQKLPVPKPLLLSLLKIGKEYVVKDVADAVTNQSRLLFVRGSIFYYLADTESKLPVDTDGEQDDTRKNKSKSTETDTDTTQTSLQHAELAIQHLTDALKHTDSTDAQLLFDIQQTLAQCYLLYSVLVPDDGSDENELKILEAVEKATELYGECQRLEPDNTQIKKVLRDLGVV